MLELALWVVGASCAAVMGFAIQYGATCTVAAVDEVLNQRTANRLTALIEAALWVGTGVALNRAFVAPQTMVTGYAVGLATVLGGVLLGLGAFINRACVFGAIGKLGCGNWAYLFTPAGYFLGRLVTTHWIALPQPQRVTDAPLLLRLPQPMIAVLALLLGVRMVHLMAVSLVPRWRAEHHRPHTATLMIGVTFLILLLSAGPWTYMDVLTDLARTGAAPRAGFQLWLLAMLIAGAVGGGWATGRLQPQPLVWPHAARCLTGGFVMALGSQLIPGQNDGLILVGMPLVWPYAWVAFLAMCVTIAGAQWLAGRTTKVAG